MIEGVQADPWFWISIVSISGWIFFLFRDLPRNYWRIPADLRRRISKVLGRPIIFFEETAEKDKVVFFSDRDRFCVTAAEVLLRKLADGEGLSRGVPPEVFAARRGGRLDS
jgi:hypothetical protein